MMFIAAKLLLFLRSFFASQAQLLLVASVQNSPASFLPRVIAAKHDKHERAHRKPKEENRKRLNKKKKLQIDERGNIRPKRPIRGIGHTVWSVAVACAQQRRSKGFRFVSNYCCFFFLESSIFSFRPMRSVLSPLALRDRDRDDEGLLLAWCRCAMDLN